MTTELMKYEADRSQHVNIAKIAHDLANAINDEASLRTAAELLVRIKEMRKKWIAKIKPMKDSAKKTHSDICTFEQEVDQPLKRAEVEILKPAMSKYEVVQERKRQADQAKLEREQQESQEDNKIDIAIEYEKKGDHETAQAIMEQPTVKIAVELPKQAQAEGISYRWNYSARVIDIESLLKAIVSGNHPELCVLPNIPYLNQRARADKESFKIPGVELVKERIVAAGGRR